jgi:hypothetical protein
MDILYSSLYVIWYIFAVLVFFYQEKSGNPGHTGARVALTSAPGFSFTSQARTTPLCMFSSSRQALKQYTHV